MGLDAKQISLRQDLPNNACELADVCSAIDNGIELSGAQMSPELPVAKPDFGEEVKRARQDFHGTEPSKTGQTKLVEMFTHCSLKPLRARGCVKLSETSSLMLCKFQLRLELHVDLLLQVIASTDSEAERMAHVVPLPTR